MILTRHVPNALSFLRGCLAPLAAIYILKESFDKAFLITLFATLTDFADGWWARRYQVTTSLGALVDAVSDKLFFSAVFIALLIKEHIPELLGYLWVGRDCFIAVGAAILWACQGKSAQLRPLIIGKIHTTIGAFYVLSILLAPYFPQNNFSTFVGALEYVVYATILGSFIAYCGRFFGLRRS